MTEHLLQKIKDLPNSPGVYVMLSNDNTIIYVGKAKILKNRVRQYFSGGKNQTDKVIALVRNIADFYYIITNNEADALMLENNLIKKHKPKYNILLKDDKTYPYIKITKEDFPKISITRKLKKDKATYFGPYTGGVAVKELLEVIKLAFMVTTCNLNYNKVPKSHRPCINYQTQNCLAPCKRLVSTELYMEQIKKVSAFLKGDVSFAKNVLEEKMYAASKIDNFEMAIKYRDNIKMVDKLSDRQIASLAKDVDIDVFSYASNGAFATISSVIVRLGRVVASSNYPLSDAGSTKEEVFGQFIMQYYENEKLPDEIILSEFEGDYSFIESAILETFNLKVNIYSPKQGIRAQLAKMCDANAFDFVEKAEDIIKRKENFTVKAAELLSKYLNVKSCNRIECYDISNISGTDKVASMVVFVGGEKLSSHYRRFKIKTVEGANDFASMEEVLNRRILEYKSDFCTDISFKSRPDLIIVDGGKGQLSSGVDILCRHGVDFDIVGLAKRNEEVFLPNKSEPVVIDKYDNALKLIVRIRDEAHRFAITYHRTLRNKNSLKTALQEVDGVGKVRQIALYKQFITLAKIKEATKNEIAEVDGIGEKIADVIFNHFHKDGVS